GFWIGRLLLALPLALLLLAGSAGRPVSRSFLGALVGFAVFSILLAVVGFALAVVAVVVLRRLRIALSGSALLRFFGKSGLCRRGVDVVRGGGGARGFAGRALGGFGGLLGHGELQRVSEEGSSWGPPHTPKVRASQMTRTRGGARGRG